MKQELVALEPELKKRSEDTNALMERLVVDQEQADAVCLSHKINPDFQLPYVVEIENDELNLACFLISV